MINVHMSQLECLLLRVLKSSKVLPQCRLWDAIVFQAIWMTCWISEVCMSTIFAGAMHRASRRWPHESKTSLGAICVCHLTTNWAYSFNSISSNSRKMRVQHSSKLFGDHSFEPMKITESLQQTSKFKPSLVLPVLVAFHNLQPPWSGAVTHHDVCPAEIGSSNWVHLYAECRSLQAPCASNHVPPSVSCIHSEIQRAKLHFLLFRRGLWNSISTPSRKRMKYDPEIAKENTQRNNWTWIPYLGCDTVLFYQRLFSQMYLKRIISR